MKLFARILAGLLGLVFIVTGVLKLMGTDTFRDAVVEHGLVPAEMAGAFALAFPIVEVTFGGAALVLAAAGRAGVAFWIGAGLFGGLALYSLGVAIRPPDGPVPCGCGFGTMVDNWWAMAMRNGVLCAGFATLAIWQRLARKARPEAA